MSKLHNKGRRSEAGAPPIPPPDAIRRQDIIPPIPLPELSSRGGRPVKFTATKRQLVIDLVRSGVPIETAMRSHALSEDTFYYWMRTGKTDFDDGKSSEHCNFFKDITRAREELYSELAAKWAKIVKEGTEKVTRTYREEMVEKPDGSFKKIKLLEKEVVETMGDGDWRGIAEFLLRRSPEQWKRIEGMEVGGPDGGPIEVSDSRLKLIEGIARRKVAKGKGGDE